MTKDLMELVLLMIMLDPLTRPREKLFFLPGIHNKRFMGPLFGVIAGGTGDRYKKKLHLIIFNLHSNACSTSAHQDGRNIQF